MKPTDFNQNEQSVNVNDSQAVIVRRKFVLRKDVVLLTMIAFIALFVMSVLTVLQTSAIARMEAAKDDDPASGIVVNFSPSDTLEGNVELSGDVVSTAPGEVAMSVDDDGIEFDMAQAISEDPNFYRDSKGAYHFTMADGTTHVCGGRADNAYIIEGLAIDLDDILGQQPVSTKQVVEMAQNCGGGSNQDKENHSSGTLGGWPDYFTELSSGYYYSYQTLYGSSVGCSASGSTSAKATATFYFYLRASTWYNTNFNPVGAYMNGWTGASRANWRADGISFRRDTFVVQDHREASAGGCNPSCSTYAEVTSPYITYRHTYCYNNYSIDKFNWDTQWKRSKTFNVYIVDKVVGIDYLYLNTSSGYSKQVYNNWYRVQSNPQSVPRYDGAGIPTNGWGKATYDFFSGFRLSTTYDGAALRTDSGAPKISGAYLSETGNTNKITSYTGSSNLKWRISASDTGGNGYTSGIWKVVVENQTTGYSKSFVAASQSVANKDYQYETWGSSISYGHTSLNGYNSINELTIPGRDANGYWRIGVCDKTETYPSSWTYYSFYYWDGIAPQFNNDVTYSVDSSYSIGGVNKQTILSAEKSNIQWTNMPVKVTGTVQDFTNSTMQTHSLNSAENVKYVQASFKYHGTYYEMSSGATNLINGNYQRKNNAITLSDVSHSVGIYKKRYTFYMPYDIEAVTDFKLYAYDNRNGGGGNQCSTSYVVSNNGTSLGKYKTDLIAPEVKSVKVKGVSGANGDTAQTYTHSDITVSMQIVDYGATGDNNYFGGNSTNRGSNGSGLKKLYFYYDANFTNPIDIVNNGVTTNVIDYGTTYLSYKTTIPIDVTLRIDTAYFNTGRIYVAAEDSVGNRSDKVYQTGSYRGLGSNDWSGSYSTNNYGGGYYACMAKTSVNVAKYSKDYYRDSYKPQVVVCKGNLTSIDVNNVIASTNTYKSMTPQYRYKYEKTNSQEFTIFFTYGCSGGTLSVKRNDNNFTLQDRQKSKYDAYNSTGRTSTGEFSPNLTYAGQYYASQSTSNTVSKAAYKWNCVHVKETEQGATTFKITFKSGSNQSSTEVIVITQLDTTAPTINLLGFSDNKFSGYPNTSQLYSSSELHNFSNWNSAKNGNGLWAIFELKDYQSGFINNSNRALSYGSYAATTNNANINIIPGVDNADVDKHYNQTQYNSEYTKSYKNIDNVAVTSTNASGCYVGFAYVNTTNNRKYTYQKYVNCYPEVYNGKWILQVKMFCLDDIKKDAKDASGNSIHKTSAEYEKGIYDISEYTYLYYKVGVSDFLGNIQYMYDDASRPATSVYKNDNNVLCYSADPFPIDLKVSFKKIAQGDWAASLAAETGSLASICQAKGITLNDYRMSNNVYDYYSWTQDYVIIELSKQGGISGLTTELKYFDLTGQFNENGDATNLKASYAALPNRALDSSTFGASEYPRTEIQPDGNIKYTTWYVIANTTKNVQVGVLVHNNAYTLDKKANGSIDRILVSKGITAVSTQSDKIDFIVKQDNIAPIFKYVYLSTDNQGKSPLLWFDAVRANDNAPYTFTLNQEKSPAFYDIINTVNSAGTSIDLLWAPSKTYVCLGVTDKPQSLDGSGVQKVMFDGQQCTLRQTEGEGNSIGIYVTNKEYSYMSRNDVAKYKMYALDNIDNRTSDVDYGGRTEEANGKKYLMFSVLDTVDPYIYMSTTSNVPFEGNYLGGHNNYAIDYTGSNNTDDKGNLLKTLCGYPTRQRQMQITIKYWMGLSGLKFYLRERDFEESYVDFNESLDASDTDIFMYYGTDMSLQYLSPLKLNYAMTDRSPRWGARDTNGIWQDGATCLTIDSLTSETTSSYSPMFNNDQTRTCYISIDVPSTRKRYDLIAVTGTRKYYLIELGDLFIDTEQPIINGDLTVFSVNSESDDPITNDNGDLVVNYSNLQHIWTHNVGYEYTNGDINIYYHVSDTASGVDDMRVNYGSNNLVLTKVIMTDIPVWQIRDNYDNVSYYFRRYASDVKPTIGKANGKITYNGVATNYRYPTEGDCEIIRTTLTDTYYKLAVTSGGSYQITAFDIAGNGPTYSPVYDINIDKTDVIFTSRMVSNSESYTGVKFTKYDVTVYWNSTYGNSGFGGFKYKVENKYNDGNFGSTFSTYTVNVPQLSSEAGYVVMTHFRNVNDHKCDLCNTCMGHIDLNNDGYCDYSGCHAHMSHKDVNGDNYCDSCRVHLRHRDTDNDGKCDDCNECLTHRDNDNDGKCDDCFKCAGEHYNKEYERTVTRLSIQGEETYIVTVKASSNKYYWYVNNKNTNIEVNQDYYGNGSELVKMEWTVKNLGQGNGSVNCKFTVTDKNAWYVYTLISYNGVLEEYSQEQLVNDNGVEMLKPVRPSSDGETIVKIDTVEPDVNLDSGNFPEISSSEFWHALARSLRVNTYDTLSGIDTLKLRKEDGTYLPDAVITYKDAEGNERQVYLNEDADGLFRAYDIEGAGTEDNRYQKLSLHFFDYHTEYTLKVTDEARNTRTVKFTPQIDSYAAKIEAMSIYKLDGSPYYVYSEQRANATQWVHDVAKRKVNWSNTALYIDFDISYGDSGFVLQSVEDYYPDDLGNDATKWEDIRSYVQQGEVSVVNGVNRVKIRLYVADSNNLMYLYTYRKYRVLSGGQYDELGTKLSDSCKPVHTGAEHAPIDSDNNKKCDVCGACMAHVVANRNANGKCTVCGNDIVMEYIYQSFVTSGSPRATEQVITKTIRIELEDYERVAIYGAEASGTHYSSLSIAEARLTGLIAIDKTTPSVTSSLLKSDDMENSLTDWNTYGSYLNAQSTHRIESGDWWKAYVRLGLKLNSESSFASGIVYYYRYYEEGIWSDWVMFDPSTNALYMKSGNKWVFFSNKVSDFRFTAKDRVHEKDATRETKISSYTEAFAYIITRSQNNTVYEMYAETGAGLITEHIRFGQMINANEIYGIKIDTNTPSVNANGAKTYATYTSTPSQETLKNEYSAKTSGNYIVTLDATYTSYDTVIVNLAIENIGYSGIAVRYRDGSTGEYKTMFEISYNEFIAYKKVNGGSAIYRYFHITQNGELIRNIRIDTNAGKSSEEKQVYIRIDNTTPIVYITDIVGTKASNWGWTDYNLYNKTEPEFWYVSELKVFMGIGVVEKNMFSNINPYSGYTIEYTTDFKQNADGSYTYGNNPDTWVTLAGNEMLLRGGGNNIVYGDTYRYRITSGAGLVYYMGEEIFNNRGTITYTKNRLNPEIKTSTTIDAITAHVSNGATGDYQDDSYLYTFFVDSNAYSYSYGGQVYLGTNAVLTSQYEGLLGNYADYEVYVYDFDHVAHKLALKELDRKFHRGDIIEIRYVSKWNKRLNESSTAVSNYFQDYTISMAEDSDEVLTYCEDYKYEKEGTIAVQFVNGKIDIISYFIAEIEVEYGQDVFYIQSGDANLQTTGTATYKTPVAYDGNLPIELEFTYYKYNLDSLANKDKLTLGNDKLNSFKITKPYEVGAYYVVTNVKAGTGSFRITNKASVNTATDRKDFVIKYFEKHNLSSDAYEYYVYNRTDFNNIDTQYFDILENESGMDRVIETSSNGVARRKTYLAANYRLMNDINILMEDAIDGTFTGKFNGEKHTITVYDELASLRTDKETCDNHADSPEGVCDVCGACVAHIDFDFDGICDFCHHCLGTHDDTDGYCDVCGAHTGHVDGDGVCNECGKCVIHLDANNDGRCDRPGCNECLSHEDRDYICDNCNTCLHIDNNDDQRCDLCNKCIIHYDPDGDGVCNRCNGCARHIDDDNDGVCDKLACQECITHIDANGDGFCDRERCQKCVVAHTDVRGDGICDVCGVCTEHKDSNDDNICDVCHQCINHIDKDDVCDRAACGKCIVHVDADHNNVCDRCGECTHLDSNHDNVCDIDGCGVCIICVDSNRDGRCDRCGGCMHTDLDNNKYCDKCGACLHIDEYGDGKCDVCHLCAFEHVDADGICDICGYCSNHVDDNLDGYCDICGFCAQHIDENGDGICDRENCHYCVNGHTDVHGDYLCNKCGSCTHLDVNNDKVCDNCGQCILHIDSNNDGKCDRVNCGQCIRHTDLLSDLICDACGYCLGDHVDTNGDELCDICGYKLRNRYESGIIRDYGLFGNIAGEVAHIDVRYDGTVIITARDNSTIGLLAMEITGKVYDITVITDVEIVSLNNGKFGGLAAKTGADAEIGGDSSIYTDVRVTNNGAAMTGANVSAFIGYVGTGTYIANAYIFGETEIYNATNTSIGTVYGAADAGTYAFRTSYYFGKNAFLNGDTIVGLSSSTAGIDMTGMIEQTYEDFVTNRTFIVSSTKVYENILARLYSDFGYDVTDSYSNGLGTPERPLLISTYDHVIAINGYMNLYFAFRQGVVIDMTAYRPSIAVTKVFNGKLTTVSGNTVITGIANGIETLDARYEGYNGLFGLFGQLNGTVEKIVFKDIDVTLNYVGTGTLYAGLVAGKSYENAKVNDVIVIGEEKVNVNNKTVVAGGVIGYSRQSEFTDIFTINNVMVVGGNAVVGGLVGIADTITLPDTEADGSVLVLGRAVARSTQMTVGGVIGSGTISRATANSVYAIKGNAYAGELPFESRPVGSLTTNVYGIKMVEFTDDSINRAKFSSDSENLVYEIVFGKGDLTGYYPLKGKGTTTNPFEVTTEEEFKQIELALYASYRISSDITFDNFETIGTGLRFTGSISGSGGDNISAEESGIAILKGLTAPLVYYNQGSVTNISLNMVVEVTVGAGETYRFGGVAIYSDGTIKNVTVSGTVDIVSETNDTTLYVSGFVAVSYGGMIEADLSKIQNSISALDIDIVGGGTVYAGGYAAVVREGEAKFSYGIATGTIDVNGANKTYGGLLVGYAYSQCEWEIGESASIEYTYTITVDGTTIPKVDEVTGLPIEENFVGIEFGR